MFDWFKKMEKSVAVSPCTEASHDRDDCADRGIHDFSDGMGLTSLATYPCRGVLRPELRRLD